MRPVTDTGKNARICYASGMGLHFFTFDPDTQMLHSAPGTVEQYPGGDVAVRRLEAIAKPHIPVAWNTGGGLDYGAVAQWVAFHRESGARPVLVMPYLTSARGDHDATHDAQTAARLTAATGVGDVIATDPHSAVWPTCALDWGLTVHMIAAASIIASSPLPNTTWDGVIAPDKGATSRASTVATMFGVPLLTAGKVRDSATGKLSGFTAPADLDPLRPGRFLVVDDICDGGGTFAGLAQSVAAVSPDSELHLWVTHGLFTGRWAENLLPHYASITAASTQPSPLAAAVPHEVSWVPLWPHVVESLLRIDARHGVR